MFGAKIRKYHNFSSENYHFYSHEKLQNIAYLACYRHVVRLSFSLQGVWIKQSGKKRIILDTTMGKPFIEIRYHRSGHIGFSKPAVKTDIIQYN